MVYLHLNSGTEKRIDRDYFCSTRDPVSKLHTPDRARWRALHYPEHYHSIDFVNPTFAREVAESHYRTSTFIFDDCGCTMSRFLNTDELGLGYAPGLFVSKAEVRITAYCHSGTFQAYMHGSVKSPELLKAALEGVFGLRRGASVCVHFLTEAKTKKERDALGLAALPELLGILKTAEGYRVRVVLDEVFEFKLNEWEEQLRHVSGWDHGGTIC
jgi:hypothetical protein